MAALPPFSADLFPDRAPDPCASPPGADHSSVAKVTGTCERSMMARVGLWNRRIRSSEILIEMPVSSKARMIMPCSPLLLLVGRAQGLYNRPMKGGLIRDDTMVLLEKHMLEFISRSVEQTKRLGARLGMLLQGGDIVCLEGALGSGKTHLAQGIGRGWGATQRLVSPSFVLIREYGRPEDEERLYHVDLYRVSGVEEVWSLGVDDFLGQDHAVSIIEWADRAQSLIPPEHLWIKIDFVEPVDATRRHLWFCARGRRHRALLREFRATAFGA